MSFPSLFGHAGIEFHCNSQTVEYQDQSGIDVSLVDICRRVTPSCQLNPLLFNGHLQTIWTVIKNDSAPIYYKRKLFQAEDPTFSGSFTVDFVVDPYEKNDSTLPSRTTLYTDHELECLGSSDKRPMLVALHGLSGGSHEIYLRKVLAPLFEKGEDWEACVVNARGCALSKVTSSVLFNARATWDVRQVVKWIRKTFPNRPLFGIGFSLGSNILVNYLSEEGSDCMLEAAVVLSNPWNLDVGDKALQRTWFGREVYSKAMGGSLKALFELNAEELAKNPAIDLEKVKAIQYLHEFDREVQCASWGYPTVGAYYRDASSADSLLGVRTPVFAINAIDDPIASHEALPIEEVTQNPFVVLCTTTLGGHLAWFQIDGERWYVKPAIGFLKAFAKDIKHGSLKSHTMTPPGASRLEARKLVYRPQRRKMEIEDTV